jgi:signal transduction histidine kinase/CheY-like chemotaxis protein
VKNVILTYKNNQQLQEFPHTKVDILVVDDLPEKLLVYEAILEDLGQNIVKARSGEEALKLILNNDFAVILLDVNMTGMDGFETAVLIRKRKKSAHTPIIFLTAFTDEMRMAQGYASGAVDYLPTPVVPDVLRAKVQVFIELSQMRQRAALQAEEQAKRKAAEEMAHRSEFLASASEVFARARSIKELASRVCEAAIPFLADVAFIYLKSPDDDQCYLQHAILNSDYKIIVDSFNLNNFPELEVSINGVIKTIEPAKILTSYKHLLPTANCDKFRDQSENYSVVIVPLTTRQGGIGALILGRPVSAPYNQNDISLVSDLLSRASAIFDNIFLLMRIQEVDIRKNEFLATLAHELRNPLAPIRNGLNILKLTERQEIRLEIEDMIARQINHMVHLVDDLMDIARITQGKIDLRKATINLSEAITHAIETSRPLIEQKEHTLSFTLPEKPIYLSADFARISQIFSNLLNNSAKYTDPKGNIMLTIEQTPEFVVVKIRDNGIGIPHEMLPRVFDMFSQVDSSLERTQGGLGIGLSLVKKLTDMHEGKIEVKSDGVNKGSEFIITLPVIASPQADNVKEKTNDISGKIMRRILVVDDNEASAKTMMWMLELLGHDIQIAHDGPTAIKIAHEYKPEVILLDIGLPQMNGYEVCKVMRRDPTLKDATFIAQTGWGQAEHRERSKEAGFTHHLVKPIDINILENLIK